MFVVVTDRWDATLGGRERYADDLVAHLAAEGRQVTKAVRGQPLPGGVTRMLALTPVGGATHYQLHGGLASQAFAAERASFDSDIRRWLFFPMLQLNRRRQRLLREETAVLAGRTALMVFSERGARDLIQHYGVAPSRITVSRPGVDLDLFHPRRAERSAGRSTSTLRLAFVAHNFALKGLASALAAVARASRDGVDVTLTVAGRGATRAYRRCAASLGIAERVTFAGALSPVEVANLLRASDALLHPTFYDPFPRVAVEALACGCPVITTAVCGASEIVTDGADGVVVRDASDLDGLTRAMTVLSDGSARNRMARAAAAKGATFDDGTHFRATSRWLFQGEDGP